MSQSPGCERLLRQIPTEVTEHSRRSFGALIGLLAFHCCAALYSASEMSATVNEPGRLVAGVGYWCWGTTAIDRVNPPLIHALSGFPPFVAGAALPATVEIPIGAGARPEALLSRRFCETNSERFEHLLFLARVPCVLISLIGMVVCWRWGSELYGTAAGTLATLLWGFCPVMIGHAAVVAADVPAATTAIAAAWLFWRWLKSGGLTVSLFCGIALGIAVCTKFTNVCLVVPWCLFGVGAAICRLVNGVYGMRQCAPPTPTLSARGEGGDSSRSSHEEQGEAAVSLAAACGIRGANLGPFLRTISGGVIIGMGALLMTNLGYGFGGSFSRLGDYRFISSRFTGKPSGDGGNRFESSLFASAPVPLPRDLILGLDTQLRDLEAFHEESYLYGEWRSRGWWHYYLVGMLVKLPVGMLLLLGMALIALRSLRGTGRFDRPGAFLLLHAVTYLAVVSSQTGLNQHFRYAIPMLPFLFCYVASLATAPSRTLRAVASACAALIVVEAVLSLPQSLSYFNFACGGPTQGHRYLLHSNLDWGQDLIPLRRFLATNPAGTPPFRLAYCGSVSPELYGIRHKFEKEDLAAIREGTIPAGTYAISANLLYGGKYSFPSSTGGPLSGAGDPFRPFRTMEPVGRAGNSMLIFEVPPRLGALLREEARSSDSET